MVNWPSYPALLEAGIHPLKIFADENCDPEVMFPLPWINRIADLLRLLHWRKIVCPDKTMIMQVIKPQINWLH